MERLRGYRRRSVLGALLMTLVAGAAGAAPMPAPIRIDDGEDASRWRALPASGVDMRITSEPGPTGRALRVDFEFTKGGGYAVLQRKVDVALPENYAFTFRMRGACRPNNLEFKLLDDSGENVWWCNRRDVTFPEAWTPQRIKRREISFAWGPRGGGVLERPAALEFAITAGQGGKGTVWFDELALQPLPPPTEAPPVLARASSAEKGRPAAAAVDTLASTAWRSRAGDRARWLELDFQGEREFGVLVLDWVAGGAARDYVVEVPDAAGVWRPVRRVERGDGGRDYLAFGETEARRLRVRATSGTAPIAVERVSVMPLDWAATPDQLYMAIAADAPRGHYPRGYHAEQSYWTVVGVDGDTEEGLFDEDARLETGRAQFSIEPFLQSEHAFVTWADVTGEATQQDGDLPIPSVRWTADSLELTTTVFGRGEPEASSLVARYVLRNPGTRARDVRLHLAIRPFQVNPPSQFLNVPGGAARIRELEREDRRVRVNGTRSVTSLVPMDAFGAATFDEGDVVAMLRDGRLPAATHLTDPIERATGVMTFVRHLEPGQSAEVALLVPCRGAPEDDPPADVTLAARWQAEVAADSRRKLDVVSISLGGPGAEVARTLRAQLGYVLVNRDGSGIQPGSRSYERSWIRDGSLTSSALLRMGLEQPVREYLEWFAPYQYADGKVPCCVDRRGSDPVPEHDSHGQLVFLMAEYLRLTGDRATVEKLWPHARAAVAYLDTLRLQRRTAEWRAPEKLHFFGILPPSISHEGYSAKPMHSYWDDFFALRGYKDGAWLAEQLGHRDDARWMAASRDTFATDFAAACRAAMAKHRIDYVPGCSDLGDFDATSTTVAMAPAQAEAVLPDSALERTFERYWEFFRKRRDAVEPYDAYTPYELRTIGAFVHLGWRERAHELMRWFFLDRRPAGWHQWAEVVDRLPRRPRFLGDMPHTWVGTDYVRSVLDMLAYERESDSALVIAAGVPQEWLADSGVVVRGLRTRWGRLDYTLRKTRLGGYSLEIAAGSLRVPPGGIEVRFAPPPAQADVALRRVVTVDGGPQADAGSSLRIGSLPASATWSLTAEPPMSSKRRR